MYVVAGPQAALEGGEGAALTNHSIALLPTLIRWLGELGASAVERSSVRKRLEREETVSCLWFGC